MANVQISIQQADLDHFLQTWAQPLLRPAAEAVKRKQEQLAPRDNASQAHMADGIELSWNDKHVDVGPRREFFYARAVEVGGQIGRQPRPFVRPSATG